MKLKNNYIFYMTGNKNKTSIHIHRIPYDIKIFSLLCILGILIRIFFASTNEYATATVWGYGFSVLALFGTCH